MPIPVTCPQCQHEYALADHLGGKRVVCAQCQAAFDVPAPVPVDPKGISDRPRMRHVAASEPPRRSNRWDDEEEYPPPRETSKGVLLVGLAAGFIVLLCAGLGVSWFLMGVDRVEPAPQKVAIANPPGQRPMLAGGGVGVEDKLPAVLTGELEPADDNERGQMIYACVLNQRRPLAGARLAAAVPLDHPPPSDNAHMMIYYNGACGAALAVAGQGGDVGQLPDKVKLMLRWQALRWLRAELARISGTLRQAPERGRAAIEQELAHWQKDTDLTAVRDPQALSQLPEAEREQWQQLWVDVQALKQKAAPGAVN
jgi:hypothetical protein